ncbi:MAG: IS5 family transposase [Spirochaetales bacterium]|nr:IS5 family transposase [Spirochaetales bacterium]MCF7937528.1 IS5 family transposase [Spirochaetales bacterium]
MAQQKGFFDEDFRLEKISKQGDPLRKLDEFIDWEMFRPILEKAFRKEAKGPGGRPPFDYVMMFKILVLQRLYNLSDAQMQFHILDRLSFMRFLSLQINDIVPDEKTIWHFRETLTKKGKIEVLFEKFRSFLMDQGVIAQSGNIVDASFVEAPKQRNSREENEEIKNGKTPEDWRDSKKSQKDTDAKWTTKGGNRYYGYKNHIKACKKTKLIKTYGVTDASVHDSQILEELLEEEDSHHEIYGDAAYSGNPIKDVLDTKNIRSRIHEKGYRNKPLTEKQKAKNKKKSKVRARVEHIFGFIHNSMNGSMVRSIGKARAEGIIGLMNLTYNMNRFIQLQRT